MPRTPPSHADQELLRILAADGVHVTPTQLERWRTQGILPRNIRHSLGRGGGSRSESAAGLADYVEALESQARQGRSAQRTVLALFMAGILQPGAGCSTDSYLAETYEAAVRRAFRWAIDRNGGARERVTAIAADTGKDSDTAEDDAYAEAEKVAKSRVNRRRLRLEQLAAEASDLQPRGREELEHFHERGLLQAALDNYVWHADGERFEQTWHNGKVPLDAEIWARRCDECSSKTTHFPTSREGQLELLNAACFCQLNRARAIGGAANMLVPRIVAGAASEPDNPVFQVAIQLCSNTVFRHILREPALVQPGQPETIVPCTLFYLHDCRWLTAAAALLIEFSLLWNSAVEGDLELLRGVMQHINDSAPRGRMLRSGSTPGTLLAGDGVLHAIQLFHRSRG